jgi:hypothetical protein
MHTDPPFAKSDPAAIRPSKAGVKSDSRKVRFP